MRQPLAIRGDGSNSSWWKLFLSVYFDFYCLVSSPRGQRRKTECPWCECSLEIPLTFFCSWSVQIFVSIGSGDPVTNSAAVTTVGDPLCSPMCSWRTTQCSSRSGCSLWLADRSWCAGDEGGERVLTSRGNTVSVRLFSPGVRCERLGI